MNVPGIGKVRVDRIKTSWQEQKEIKNIMLFLQSHEVSTSHATKIFKTYGSESIEVVKENPYRLADDIWGIGFKTADSICAENGHCYANRKQLLEKAQELLEVDEPEIQITLDEMLRTNDVIEDTGLEHEVEEIYLPPYFFSETGCAKRLFRLMSVNRKIKVDPDVIMKKVETESEITYDEIQLEAVRTAISAKFF